MLPKFHILTGFIFSIIFYFVFPKIPLLGLVIFFFSSFLIDFDHYIYYAFKKKDFSLKNSYFWFKEKGKRFSKVQFKERKKYFLSFLCFHGLEGVLLFTVLGYFLNYYFYFVGAGMFFHLFFDWIYSIKDMGRLEKVSIIFDYLRNKKLKYF